MVTVTALVDGALGGSQGLVRPAGGAVVAGGNDQRVLRGTDLLEDFEGNRVDIKD